MRRLAAVLSAVVAGIYAAFVAVKNQDPIPLNLLFASFEAELWVLLTSALLVGAAAAALGLSWPYLRLRLLVRRQNRRITRLEQEVHGLRTLPLGDEEAQIRR